MGRLASLAAIAFVATSAWADVALRLDSTSAKSWETRPAWVGNASAQATVTANQEKLDFAISEPGKGMKWALGFEQVDVVTYRWLVVKYRLVNYATKAPDYLFWLNAETGKDGLRLLPPKDPPYDDQPHVVAFDLAKRGAGDTVSTIAVQCQAGPQGQAHVLVESIEFADRPPAGAEGDIVPVAERRTVAQDVLNPALWQAHKDWLANPGTKFAAQAADGRLRLEVDEAGTGMKWSTNLPQPVEGMQWLSVRCRAANLDPQTGNYFLYLASAGGGKALDEQYCINLNDLPADGEWHVVTAPVTVKSIRTIALQVQARGALAFAEIDWLRFSTVQPEMKLADVLPYEPAKALQPYEKAIVPAVVGADPRVRPSASLVPSTDAMAGLDVVSWFDAPMVTVRGVTFALADNGAKLAATPYKDLGEIKVPVDLQASELYLLLGARYARTEEPSYGGGQLRKVVDPHRCVVAVTYEDGMVDEFVPARIGPQPAGDYGVYKGIDAYAVGPLAEKKVREIALRDGMRNGGFYLAAVTANVGQARVCTEKAEKPYAVSTTPAGLAPGSLPGLSLSGPVFSVKVGDRTLTMDQFQSQTTGKAGVAVGTATVGQGRVGYTFTTQSEAPGKLAVRLELKNEGTTPVDLQPNFPDLPAIQAPKAWGDTWYFFPRRGCVINHVPIGLREAYSGAFPFQVESVFWPEAGVGTYLMTRDLDLTFRYFRLSKDAGGVRMSIEYPTVTLAPGETWKSVDTVIGRNDGDWHGAWQAYRDWMATWYRPAAPRKAWFRKVFNFRQQFMHFGAPEKSGIFDDQTKAYHFDEAVEADAKAFGGVDYLHLFDWGWSEKYGRCGDYDHWEQIGSAPAFAQAIAGLQNRSLPVGLYLEGYLVDPESNYGKAHGAEYQLIGPDGKPYDYFAPSYDMCSAVKEWQDYLAGVYKRTREATGALGYYVDEMGFTDPGHLCYAKTHGHPVPWGPAPGQRDLMRKIREGLGPEAALYTEESPPDVTSQFQDGSFTYNISSVSDEWSPTHLNLYRFTVPTFKTFEIITCDHPLGSNVQAVKRVFFSGEGIWLEGLADKWFTPETRATIAKTHAILTKYADAFTSDSPTPLVPTLMGNVYANQFPASDSHRLCVWTLYNANPRTVRGPVLRVPHLPNTKYLDAWRDQPANVKIEGDEAVISLELGPRDVGCIARVEENRAAIRPGKVAVILTGGMDKGEPDQLEALLIGEGVTVTRVSDPREGVPEADLIVIDTHAPRWSALEFAASVVGRGEGRPAVLLLVHEPAEVKAAHDAGADACLTVPFDREDARTIARRLMGLREK